jgi:hypothetical protein
MEVYGWLSDGHHDALGTGWRVMTDFFQRYDLSY